MQSSRPRRLGPYELAEPIGAGGMGEVYKAIDTRLQRAVAIKLLPPHLVVNPARRRRFEREAQTISNLTHPHICTVYDIGDQDGWPFLVMEFLDGETLAARLQRGPLPVKEATRIAAEIAAALDHAHRQHVVHRDLKPANIMLTGIGAKLLDFGVARLLDSDGTSGAGTGGLETLTEEGTILGTVQYMAPEQLEARETDARADVFAFGSVIYEMLAGRPAFTGATKASVIAAILERDPVPLVTVRDSSPPRSSGYVSPLLESAVMRCLAKNPSDRWQTAADLGAALRWAAEGDDERPVSGPVSGPRRRPPIRRWLWAAAAVEAAVIAGIAYGHRLTLASESPPPVFAFAVNPPPGGSFAESSAAMAVSPDGRYLAFVASGPEGNLGLWLRSRETLTVQRLPGTVGGVQPFWSPDSGAIGFFSITAPSLRKIDVTSKLVQVITQVPGGQAGSWNRDGVVLFTSHCPVVGTNESTTMVCRVDRSGGETRPATRIDSVHGETRHAWPQFLPDGRHFLYIANSRLSEFNGVVYAASLDDPTPVRITSADSNAVYAPPGFLVFMRGTALVAQRFDAAALRLEGEPMLIADPVERNIDSLKGAFSLSTNGVVAYREPQQTELEWRSMDGRPLGTVASASHYANPVLSPDGSRIAVERSSGDVNTMDVWLYDRSGGATRFSIDHPSQPLWSPDGQRLALRAKDGIVVRDAATRNQHTVVADAGLLSRPLSWTPDGQSLLYDALLPATREDIFIIPVSGGTPKAIVQTPFDDTEAQVSPDGRWLAYVSDESGQNEVYVRPFPDGDAEWRVSTNGGVEPQWTRDALLYLASDRALMSVAYTTGKTFVSKPAVRLFQTRMSASRNAGYTRNQYLVSGDGRILINQPHEDAPPPGLMMIVNWPSLLKTPH